MPLPTRNVVGTYPGQAGKTIRFTLTDTVSDESDGDTALAGTVVTATIDSQGDFSIALFCQGATLNGPPIYTARPLFGLAPKYTISVPAGSGSIDLSQLITLPPTPTPPTAFAQLVDLTAETARATAAETAEATARATADALAVPLTQKGAAGGVATLDGAGTIPDAQIPATITRDTELTAAVSAAVSALVAGAPGALDTLDELAAAFGDDANFAATVTAALAGKQPLDADLTAIAALSTTSYGRAFLALADASAAKTALSLVKGDVGLGNVDNTADTAKPVSTAQQTALDLKAPLASPALTGTPTAPTQTAGNSSTRLATTAYTDTAVATQHTADNGTYLSYLQGAMNPDLIIAGTITRDTNGTATAAPVVWPDGSTGTYTADTVSAAFPGAVDAYHVTKVTGGVTTTYTQAAVTRDASTGAVTVRPAMTVA